MSAPVLSTPGCLRNFTRPDFPAYWGQGGGGGGGGAITTPAITDIVPPSANKAGNVTLTIIGTFLDQSGFSNGVIGSAGPGLDFSAVVLDSTATSLSVQVNTAILAPGTYQVQAWVSDGVATTEYSNALPFMLV
jgi:hypothetical protein